MKEFKHKSVSVKIDDSGESEVLEINGKVVSFRKSKEGYAIFYHDSFETLEKAVKNYIDNQ